MVTLPSPAPVEAAFEIPDLGGIGLVLAIVGSLMLANSILSRHPRALVREHFGKKPLHLRNIRQYIFHRVQVTVGFAFLLSGFCLQLFGRYGAPTDLNQLEAAARPVFPTFWVVGVVLLAGTLLAVAWWWSRWAFQRYVRDHFTENPVDFELNGPLAREIGELFGIVSYGDDTVQSYATRLRLQAGLEAPRAPHLRPVRDMEDSSDSMESEALELEERLI